MKVVLLLVAFAIIATIIDAKSHKMHAKNYNKMPVLRRLKRASNDLYRHRPNHQNCDDLRKDIENREEEANVIFTGTVKGIYNDFYHPGMYKGLVEIKRVFKGENEISVIGGLRGPPSFYRQEVFIEGFGDPHICFSDVRRHDTRIFMVTKMNNGELKLNSSLMRVTLNNLEKADAAVKGMSFYLISPPICKWYHTQPLFQSCKIVFFFHIVSMLLFSNLYDQLPEADIMIR